MCWGLQLGGVISGGINLQGVISGIRGSNGDKTRATVGEVGQ